MVYLKSRHSSEVNAVAKCSYIVSLSWNIFHVNFLYLHHTPRLPVVQSQTFLFVSSFGYILAKANHSSSFIIAAVLLPIP